MLWRKYTEEKFKDFILWNSNWEDKLGDLESFVLPHLKGYLIFFTMRVIWASCCSLGQTQQQFKFEFHHWVKFSWTSDINKSKTCTCICKTWHSNSSLRGVCISYFSKQWGVRLNCVLTCLVGWNWFGAQQISVRIPVACIGFCPKITTCCSNRTQRASYFLATLPGVILRRVTGYHDSDVCDIFKPIFGMEPWNRQHSEKIRPNLVAVGNM
jgi:hypothetical protein